MSLLKLENVSYRYKMGPLEVNALEDINLTIDDNEFIGIMGYTGAGKSTLLQIIAGLIAPTGGKIIYRDRVKDGKLKKKVGLLFQFPEHQLFAETVETDIAFGPKNLGLTEAEIRKRVKSVMERVGLSYERYAKRSPFSLSGGEKRKVALAGILVLNPEILVLDEPTVGLDTRARADLMGLLQALRKDGKKTIVMASHNINDLVELADRLVVLEKGKVVLAENLNEIFKKGLLRKEGPEIEPPVGYRVLQGLRKRGIAVRDDLFRLREVEEEIVKAFRRGKRCSKDLS